MRRVILRGWALALGVVGALALAGPTAAQEKKVIIGVQCDRTGPTQIVGTVICPAFQDYFNYINSQGGIEGYKIEAPEIDNGYKVPPAVEAYERQKQQGAVMMSAYGTPQTQALNERLKPTTCRRPRPVSDRPRRTASAIRTCSRLRQATSRRAPPQSTSSNASSGAACKARRSPICITTTRLARSRCRSSRICRGPKDLICAPSPAAAGGRDGCAGA